jgi:predicted MFS family arabinose efflux permease
VTAPLHSNSPNEHESASFKLKRPNMEMGRAAMRPMWLIPPGVLMVACTYGLARYTYGLFVPQIRGDLELDTQTIGFIASGSYVGFLIASAVTTVVAGRTGPRLPAVIGAASAAVGMLLIGLSTGVATLAVGVVLAGASPGWAYTPYSDAVVRLIAPEAQDRTYAIINSGTSFGVIVSGPLALWAGSEWRTAWLAFAALALVAAIWNAVVLPSGPHHTPDADETRLHWRWLVTRASARLFGAALVIGLGSSAYWTFAVDLVVSERGGDTSVLATLFWTSVGLAGVAGGIAGDTVARFGLASSLAGAVIAIALATGLLATAPKIWLAVIVSAVLFGAAFIAVTGILGIWSIYAFHDRPSAGFGTTFFFISLGQLIGPSVFALTASASSLTVAFYCATAVTMSTLLIRPIMPPAKDAYRGVRDNP